MTINIKLWLSIATTLIILGVVLFTVTACSATKSGFGALFSGKAEETVTDITEDFNKIDILTDTADISFVLTDDESCKAVANDKKNVNYTVKVENDTLKINSADERRWYEYLFNFTKSSLTVYLPKSQYESLTIDEDTGDITVPAYFKFESVNITLSTGDVNFYASTAKSIKVAGSTGDVKIEGLNTGYVDVAVSTGKVAVNGAECEGDINVKVSTGDVLVANSACKNLSSEGSTGDFTAKEVKVSETVSIRRSTGKTELSDVSCSNLTAIANTGDLDMTNVTAGGSFSIERSTGDVRFDGCDAAEIFVTTDTGSVKGTLLTEKIFIPRSDTGKIDVPKTTNGGRCEITTSTGNIQIILK